MKTELKPQKSTVSRSCFGMCVREKLYESYNIKQHPEIFPGLCHNTEATQFFRTHQIERLQPETGSRSSLTAVHVVSESQNDLEGKYLEEKSSIKP